MQIPPSNSLLQALSGHSHQTSGAVGVRSPKQAEAAAAARAVFSQLKAPASPASAPAANQVTAAPSAQAIPGTQPNRPLPRGSIINILV